MEKSNSKEEITSPTESNENLLNNAIVATLSNKQLYTLDNTTIFQCKQLRKLDLSNNNLTEIPPPDSWKQLSNLQILYLHDNQIQSLRCVESLEKLQNLIYLTLYNNPVTFHEQYRPYVVNQITSLKALDHHIVADTEILDGANLDGVEIFLPLSKGYQIPLPFEYGNKIPVSQAVNHEIRLINLFYSRSNPSTMIQRVWRAYRVKKNLNSKPVSLQTLRTILKAQTQNIIPAEIQKPEITSPPTSEPSSPKKSVLDIVQLSPRTQYRPPVIDETVAKIDWTLDKNLNLYVLEKYMPSQKPKISKEEYERLVYMKENTPPLYRVMMLQRTTKKEKEAKKRFLAFIQKEKIVIH